MTNYFLIFQGLAGIQMYESSIQKMDMPTKRYGVMAQEKMLKQ